MQMSTDDRSARMEEAVKETINDILQFAEAVMDECNNDRLDKKYFEVGFNLKTAILLSKSICSATGLDVQGE
jgi:hypothetical protein